MSAKDINLVCKCDGRLFTLRITASGELVAVCESCGETKRVKTLPARRRVPPDGTKPVKDAE